LCIICRYTAAELCTQLLIFLRLYLVLFRLFLSSLENLLPQLSMLGIASMCHNVQVQFSVYILHKSFYYTYLILCANFLDGIVNPYFTLYKIFFNTFKVQFPHIRQLLVKIKIFHISLRFFKLFKHLCTCAYILWAISPPAPCHFPLSSIPPRFQAEPALLLSVILLKRRYNQ
jgi:hypothetical protein